METGPLPKSFPQPIRPSQMLGPKPPKVTRINSTTVVANNYTYDEDTALSVDQLESKPKTSWFVYILTIFSAIGGFLFGYDTGVISGAMILLRDEFSLSLVWQEMVVSVIRVM